MDSHIHAKKMESTSNVPTRHSMFEKMMDPRFMDLFERFPHVTPSSHPDADGVAMDGCKWYPATEDMGIRQNEEGPLSQTPGLLKLHPDLSWYTYATVEKYGEGYVYMRYVMRMRKEKSARSLEELEPLTALAKNGEEDALRFTRERVMPITDERVLFRFQTPHEHPLRESSVDVDEHETTMLVLCARRGYIITVATKLPRLKDFTPCQKRCAWEIQIIVKTIEYEKFHPTTCDYKLALSNTKVEARRIPPSEYEKLCVFVLGTMGRTENKPRFCEDVVKMIVSLFMQDVELCNPMRILECLNHEEGRRYMLLGA